MALRCLQSETDTRGLIKKAMIIESTKIDKRNNDVISKKTMEEHLEVNDQMGLQSCFDNITLSHEFVRLLLAIGSRRNHFDELIFQYQNLIVILNIKRWDAFLFSYCNLIMIVFCPN